MYLNDVKGVLIPYLNFFTPRLFLFENQTKNVGIALSMAVMIKVSVNLNLYSVLSSENQACPPVFFDIWHIPRKAIMC